MDGNYWCLHRFCSVGSLHCANIQLVKQQNITTSTRLSVLIWFLLFKNLTCVTSHLGLRELCLNFVVQGILTSLLKVCSCMGCVCVDDGLSLWFIAAAHFQLPHAPLFNLLSVSLPGSLKPESLFISYSNTICLNYLYLISSIQDCVLITLDNKFWTIECYG